MSELFTVVPEFVYTETLRFKTRRSEPFVGKSVRSAIAPFPKRRVTLRWRSMIASERAAVESFMRHHVGGAGSFLYRLPDPVVAPYSAGTPGTTPQTAFSYGARTYYYALTYVTAEGESLGSNVQSFALAEETLFTIRVPKFPANVIAANVYLNTTTTVKKQTTVTVSNSTWVEADIDDVNSVADGDELPTVSTAYEEIEVFLDQDDVQFDKETAGVYSCELTFQEI